jgi:hypothetical protein
MHRMTHRSHRMQKCKFSVICPGALFVKCVPVPHEHEKLCVDVSWPGLSGKHYVTHRSPQMQKHKFNVMCQGASFIKAVSVPPEHEK